MREGEEWAAVSHFTPMVTPNLSGTVPLDQVSRSDKPDNQA
jgi:hypothetical protein